MTHEEFQFNAKLCGASPQIEDSLYQVSNKEINVYDAVVLSQLLKEYPLELPDDMIVLGHLNLRGSLISTLPNKLTVHGNALLDFVPLVNLPDELCINGNISLYGTPITYIPDDSVLNGDVHVGNTKINKITRNFFKGSLNLIDTEVKTLPDDIQVLSSLITPKSLLHLPEYLKAESIRCCGAMFNTIPSSINVESDIDLAYSKIRYLPDNLTVWSSLRITNCWYLDNLPKNLTVKMHLYMTGTHIKVIPECLKAGVIFKDF